MSQAPYPPGGPQAGQSMYPGTVSIPIQYSNMNYKCGTLFTNLTGFILWNLQVWTTRNFKFVVACYGMKAWKNGRLFRIIFFLNIFFTASSFFVWWNCCSLLKIFFFFKCSILGFWRRNIKGSLRSLVQHYGIYHY